MIEQGIYQFLAANVAISAIVGTDVFEQAFPQDTDMPLVVFSSISSTPVNSLDGENGLQIRRFRFRSYDATGRGARTLQNAVRSAFSAVATGATFPDGSVLQAARIMLDIDTPFEPGPGGTIYCSALDIELSFVPS